MKYKVSSMTSVGDLWRSCLVLSSVLVSVTTMASQPPPPHPGSYDSPTLTPLDCPGTVSPVVTPSNGPICGGVPAAYPTLRAFWGIPYAKDTSGDNRWRAPVELTETVPGTGTPLPAHAFGPWCPQLFAIGNGKDRETVPVGAEDCLRVNVWTPDVNGKLPVMVFIYGGAFVGGASNLPSPTRASNGMDRSNVYDGGYLSQTHNVVFVSLNYRLGAMGFLAKDQDLSGNYGFLDQQAALRWVQRNIHAFGGDKTKVTIFGESAGGMSVGLHMLSAPGSYGENLFRAGIMQSNLPRLPYKKPVEGKKGFKKLVDHMPDCRMKLGQHRLDCLREASLEDLLSAQGKVKRLAQRGEQETVLPWTPVVDGHHITNQPYDGKLRHPAILGTNQNEGIIFAAGYLNTLWAKGNVGKRISGADKYDLALQHFFVPRKAEESGNGASVASENDVVTKIENHYAQSDSPDALDQPKWFLKAQHLSKIVTDYVFTCANHSLAQVNASGTVPLYTYRFDQTSSPNHFYVMGSEARVLNSNSEHCPGVGNAVPKGFTDAAALLCQCLSAIGGRGGNDTAASAVCHGAELPFVFNSPGYATRCRTSSVPGTDPCTFTEQQISVAQNMAAMWASFATDPSQAPDPRWKDFRSGGGYFVFNDDGTATMGSLPDEDTCNFWNKTAPYPEKSTPTTVEHHLLNTLGQ